MKNLMRIVCVLLLTFTFLQCQNDDEVVPKQQTEPEINVVSQDEGNLNGADATN